jgi:outer membrane lipoprotein-sorting protein
MLPSDSPPSLQSLKESLTSGFWKSSTGHAPSAVAHIGNAPETHLDPDMKTKGRTLSHSTGGRIPAAIFMVLFPLLSAGEPEDKLGSVLNRMEKASRNLQSFVAEITTTKFTAILERFDHPERGKFFFRRADNGSALIRLEIVDPGERILTIQNDEALSYQPRINSASKFKLGKNKDKAEYLVLGIGQYPKNLNETFHIAYRGRENVHGTACSILELKPRNPKASSMFSAITVWIKDSSGISTRMRLEEPFGDYVLVTFSNEQLNTRIDDSKFRQVLPNNVDMLEIN